MRPLDLSILLLICFATSIVSVVTGGTSLITVPAMLLFGIAPRVAIATNMFALMFLSIGASLPFVQRNEFDNKRLPFLVILTVFGSASGALLVFHVPEQVFPFIIAAALLGTPAFVLSKPSAGINRNAARSQLRSFLGYLSTFLLGIYGGFFSGGYVTLLTAVWMAFFRMPFKQSIATTKLMNAASSLVAVLIFAGRGMIDWRLGALLSFTMFLGATVGAHLTLRLSDLWLRRVFVSVVVLLALKMLVLNVPWERLTSLLFGLP